MTIKEKTIALIDALKATCQTYGMGNDGNEYKIITQVFLYKFINDKFGYEVKRISPKTTKRTKRGCTRKSWCMRPTTSPKSRMSSPKRRRMKNLPRTRPTSNRNPYF